MQKTTWNESDNNGTKYSRLDQVKFMEDIL